MHLNKILEKYQRQARAVQIHKVEFVEQREIDEFFFDEDVPSKGANIWHSMSPITALY